MSLYFADILMFQADEKGDTPQLEDQQHNIPINSKEQLLSKIRQFLYADEVESEISLSDFGEQGEVSKTYTATYEAEHGALLEFNVKVYEKEPVKFDKLA